MAHPQLIHFIQLQLSTGMSEDEIRSALAGTTWTPADIDEAFAAIQNPHSIPVPIKPDPAAGPTIPSVQPGIFAPGPFLNSSGHGRESVVPPEVKRWNWGAFGFGWIWGIGNGVWIALLCFIPLVNLVMIFVLGAKGSEWAWRNERWESVEHFKRVQHRWTVAWLIMLVLALVFFAAAIALSALPSSSGFGLSAAQEQARDAERVENISQLQEELEIYYVSNSSYPATLSQLTSESAMVPVDPSTQQPYQYQSSGTSYTLCATMEESNPTLPQPLPSGATFSGSEYCVSPPTQQ